MLVWGGLATGTADAFLGEGAVVTPTSPPDLTGPAKTIITNPTFLPETVGEAGAASGTSEAAGAAAVAESSGLLPVLGSVLSFGVGTVIGSEICHVVGIEGCWYFGSEGADPKVETGSWSLLLPGVSPSSSPKSPSAIPDQYRYSWYFNRPGSESDYTAYGQTFCEFFPPNPPGSTAFVSGFTENCRHSKTPLVEGPVTYAVAIRSAMANRELTYHPLDESGISNYEPSGKPYAAPSNWSQKMAEAIKEKEGSTPAGRFGEKVAHGIEGSGVADPYASHGTVPNCGGLTYAQCESKLEQEGLKPVKNTLGWESADLKYGANVVTKTAPAAGTVQSVGTTVTVTVNPATLPLLVPQWENGETFSHYAARLPEGATAHRVDVGEAFTDPSVGPNAVLRTVPEPGTRLDPETSHEIDVQTNPETAPEPAGGGFVPPSIPTIDMSPLSGIPDACSVFPFGLFCWFGSALGQFNTSGVCPHTEVPVSADANFDLSLCGETSEEVMSYFRPALLFAFIIGLGFMFARGTKAVGSDE